MTHSHFHLIYLVYGRQTYHQEALFSLASAIAHLRDEPNHGVLIRIFTDNPEPYVELPVQLYPLSADELAAWLPTARLSLPRQACRPSRGHTRCGTDVADRTDTFFHCSPLRLFERVRPGCLLYNAIGVRHGESPDLSLYRDLSGYLAKRSWYNANMARFNSGVIGLTHSDARVLDRSLELMDELYPIANGAYTLKEFVLAVATYKRLEPVSCTDLIYYYWSRKQLFRAKIQAWLCKHGSSLLSTVALNDTLKVTPPATSITCQALTVQVGSSAVAGTDAPIQSGTTLRLL